MHELQSLLVQAIRSYISTSPLNRLRDLDGSPIWEEPLVGFADGDDPLFALYREVVAPEHMTPREALAVGWGEAQSFAHVGVVAWILPIAAETRRSNREQTKGPSLRWNHARIRGEECNDGLRRHMVAFLEQQGLVAVAPALTPAFRRAQGLRGQASTWSERHAAYAAGLGTFGLSDGLITARGIAHRCGSVVVNAAWPATPRPYTRHQEYCPYVRDGSCGVCIARCPARAIGPDGHDKDRCQQYIRANWDEWLKQPGYLGGALSCGLCQTGVPCETRIP